MESGGAVVGEGDGESLGEVGDGGGAVAVEVAGAGVGVAVAEDIELGCRGARRARGGVRGLGGEGGGEEDVAAMRFIVAPGLRPF